MSEPVERQDQPVATRQDAGTIMNVISRAASDPSTDVEKLDRLLSMYERIEARQAEIAYQEALSRLQAELPEITERGEIRHNDKLISTYAKWEHINRAIKPILRAHGFSLSFRVDTDGKVRVEGVLSHERGHSERTGMTLPADTSGAKNPVQAVASSVSYGKRYVAEALLNITSHGQDDDGQGAGAPTTITDEQAHRIADLIAATEADESALLRWVFGGTAPEGATVSDIPATMYERVVAALKRKQVGK